jgi:hypothetical protein
LYSGNCIPAPWAIDGGGGLSTIWGFCFMKREKKLAHILIESFNVSILIIFYFVTDYRRQWSDLIFTGIE